MSKKQGFGKIELSTEHKTQIAQIVASIITLGGKAAVLATGTINPVAIAGIAGAATISAGNIYKFLTTKPDNDLCKKLADQIENIENPDPDIIDHDMIESILKAAARKIQEKAEENDLLTYRENEDALFQEIWNEKLLKDPNTQKAKEYYRDVLRVISSNILISDNEMLSYLLNMKEEISSYIKKAEDEDRCQDDKRDQQFRILLQAIQAGNTNVQTNVATQSSLYSDNRYYIKMFESAMFLDTDNPNIKLRNMFIPPMADDKDEHLTAVDAIQTWYSSDIPCMVLYGEAGIGKSSLVAKIVSQACEDDDLLDTPNSASILAISLRKHIDIFREYVKGYNSVIDDVLNKLFCVRDSLEMTDKLLILDGFDELTVLVPGFQAKAAVFLQNLADACENENLHVLITSRKDYFYIKKQHNISEITLCWDKEQVADWCNRYGALNPKRTAWCIDFPKKYNDLQKKNDQRANILCIPFVLYLCCNSKIELDDSKTLCQIYDRSFRTLLMRAHGKALPGFDRFENSPTDKLLRLVYWQYAKELAYQMFLLDTLDLSNAGGHDDKKYIGLQNAKNRTVECLKEKYPDQFSSLDVKELRTTEFLSLFSFAQSNMSDSEPDSEMNYGITFAHKTVYEYFTAVKLYEDYFAKFSKSYFDARKNEKGKYTPAVVDEVMESFIKAFRYKPLKEKDHIFLYLCEMNEPQFNGENRVINEDERFDFEQYSKVIIIGMNSHYLSAFDMPMSIEAYQTSEYMNLPISAQLNLAFCNFTWFLTGRGFENPTKCMSYNLGDLISSRYHNVNLGKWNLSHSHLEKADLIEANLETANLGVADLFAATLKRANLKRANLQLANLQEADLHEADLQEANLRKADLQLAKLQLAKLQLAKLQLAKLLAADLKGANLEGANLEGADLEGADLEEAILKEADLKRAILEEAVLRDANLKKANLLAANLQMVDLRGADLQDADLQEANLQRAKLQDAKLQRANLQGAYLQRAYLQGVNLQGANLEGVNLQETSLQEVNLQGVNLKRAKLQDAKLQGVKLVKANLEEANLEKAILEEAVLRDANLKKANLKRANLKRANLQGADLQGADLRGANLQGTQLEWADLRGARYSAQPNEPTAFPAGFIPQDHGMIEVDRYGMLVRRSGLTGLV